MPVQDQAFGLVVARFAPQMSVGGAGGAALTEPLVFWWTTPCPGTNVSAVIRGPRCYSGLYEHEGAVDVAWRGSFGQSAYAHELMHYFLEQQFGDSDAAHQQEARWSLVQETDLELQAQGL